MDLRQIILLMIAVAVPLVLFHRGRPDLVLAWVCFTLGVHIFDTTTVTNLPAGRIVGLLCLPYLISRRREWTKLMPVKLWLINFGLLLILGIVFGFIFPWGNNGVDKSFGMTAPGRAIIYPIRLIADLGLTAFCANELLRPGAIMLSAR